MALRRETSPTIIGIDEAGRGAWAGPIVGAAVLFQKHTKIPKNIIIRDSKTMSPDQRVAAARYITANAYWSIASVSSIAIDEFGIQEANRQIFRRSFEKLRQIVLKSGVVVDSLELRIDGRRICDFDCAHQFVVGGDSRFNSISAASIVAKVARDHIMRRMALQFKEYGFDKHKGYGTRVHAEALHKYGVTAIHRLSYRPVHVVYKNFSKGV